MMTNLAGVRCTAIAAALVVLNATGGAAMASQPCPPSDEWSAIQGESSTTYYQGYSSRTVEGPGPGVTTVTQGGAITGYGANLSNPNAATCTLTQPIPGELEVDGPGNSEPPQNFLEMIGG
jgi:hypothetical protein